MKTLILDGSHSDDPLAERLNTTLQKSLLARGWDSELITLRDKKIGVCAGDFFCWVKNPGQCNTDDDNRIIAAKFMQAELVVLLTPVTFGGFSSQLKRMLDHLIQNVSPYFTRIHGEIHHQKRYQNYPRVIFAGWLSNPNPQAEDIFRHLSGRVSINMNSGTSICEIIHGAPNDEELAKVSENWLKDVVNGQSSLPVALPVFETTGIAPQDIKRAVLLVGSPRTAKSTSASLGEYLMEQLAMRGIQTSTIQIYTSINSAERTQNMLEEIQHAGLVVLAYPLYVDSLSAPVISALEKISQYRKSASTPASFVALANCGFPEARHNETSLAICAQFARQSGFIWRGGLALGGGEGIVHGLPLNQIDGRAHSIRQALNLAAEALAAGMSIPAQAYVTMAKPVIPAWLYALLGNLGWKQSARQYGVHEQLKKQPYLWEK